MIERGLKEIDTSKYTPKTIMLARESELRIRTNNHKDIFFKVIFPLNAHSSMKAHAR